MAETNRPDETRSLNKLQSLDHPQDVKPCRLKKRLAMCAMVFLVCALFLPLSASAANNLVEFNVGGESTDTLEIIIMLTFIMLLPSILIVSTCFTRIIIILSFLRNAMGLQQTPPNQVLIALALFLSLFIMNPTLQEINTTAYEPYKNEQITQEEFFQRAEVPLKQFMLRQTKTEDINLFVELSKTPETPLEELPLTVIIPSFMSSELKRAFTAGFLLFIPFLIIDMIVSSTLMSMGMIMLPPVMISLPFKILLFVLVNGWDLLFKTLVVSFQM